MFTQKSLKVARIKHPKILCFFQTLSKQSFKIKDKSQKEEQEIK